MKKVDGLQALRGIAAGYVFLFHLAPVSGLAEVSPILKNFARWGFSGVDIFFVLSGFLMWQTTHDKSGAASARRFLLKRFSRIYLGYWPWLAFTFAIFALFAPGSLVGKNLVGSLLLLEGDYLRLVIGAAWSLSYELYFYVFFAWTLLVKPPRRIVMLSAALSGVVAFNLYQLAFHREMLSGELTLVNFALSPFAIEFLAGSLLAIAIGAGGNGLNRNVLPIFGFLLAALGAWMGVSSGELPVNQLQRIASFGLAAFGLVLVVVSMDDRIEWPSWLVALGDQSYALYLGHPILLSLAEITGLFSFSQGQGVITVIVTSLIALTAILATRLCYDKVEVPLYRWAGRRIGPEVACSGSGINAA